MSESLLPPESYLLTPHSWIFLEHKAQIYGESPEAHFLGGAFVAGIWGEAAKINHPLIVSHGITNLVTCNFFRFDITNHIDKNYSLEIQSAQEVGIRYEDIVSADEYYHVSVPRELLPSIGKAVEAFDREPHEILSAAIDFRGLVLDAQATDYQQYEYVDENCSEFVKVKLPILS